MHMFTQDIFLKKMMTSLDCLMPDEDKHIPLQHVMVLFGVAIHKDISLVELSARLGITTSSTSRALAKLEKEYRWVKKIPDPEEYRKKLCRLTPKGLDVVKEVHHSFETTLQ